MNYFKGPWQFRKPVEGSLKTFCEIFPKLTLFDLGAAGGTPPPFLFLGEELDLVTFEPEPEAEVAGGGKNCPVAIGPRELKTLYLNRRPTTSSLLRPNKQVVDRYDWQAKFSGEGDIFETVKELEIETVPLDCAISEYSLPKPDFLKIDVQGLTYEVLQGAEGAMRDSILGIQVEMEFSECYQGQRTFGAVHELLLEMGFEIFGLSNLNHWPYKTDRKVRQTRGQDVFCDMTYFRSPESFFADGRDNRKMLEKVVSLLLLHDFSDAAMAYLEMGLAKGVITSDHGAFKLVQEWPGSLDYFYEVPTLERLLTFRSRNLLDVTPRKFFRMIKKSLKL